MRILKLKLKFGKNEILTVRCIERRYELDREQERNKSRHPTKTQTSTLFFL